MRFGDHTVGITVRTSDGEKFFNEVVVTDEMLDGGRNIDIFASEIDRTVVNTLNKAYDEYEFTRGDYNARRDLQKQLIWEKVKNINTDEELEVIKEVLELDE